jgi:hypothetical protein
MTDLHQTPGIDALGWLFSAVAAVIAYQAHEASVANAPCRMWQHVRSCDSGSLAIFAATRLALSLESIFDAVRRPGSSSKESC